MPLLVRRAIVLAAVTPLIVLLVGAAQAGAAVERTPFSFSEPVINPCNGETGTLSATGTMTLVTRDTSNQTLFQLTTQTDEAFAPDNPASPSATGHGVSHDTFIDNHVGGPPLGGTNIGTHISTDVFFASGAHVVIHETAVLVFVDGTSVVSFDRPVLVCTGV
jgi:hypothetical protein